VRVAVLGLTNPNVPHWEFASHWAGLSFSDPVAVAAARVPELRKSADVVIVVVHAGFERDLETGAAEGSEDENFAWRLAQLDGIDLLLTGHTHRDIPPRAQGKTVVAQPGRWAERVTRVDFDLGRKGRGWGVIGWHGENLKAGGETPDPRVVSAVAEAEARVKREFARSLGRLEVPLKVTSLPMSDGQAWISSAVQLEASAPSSRLPPAPWRWLEFPAGVVTAPGVRLYLPKHPGRRAPHRVASSKT
jgi:2',3'-cyclic-nucleotide 2'-phosphodiesterase/3'-nucleotidase